MPALGGKRDNAQNRVIEHRRLKRRIARPLGHDGGIDVPGVLFLIIPLLPKLPFHLVVVGRVVIARQPGVKIPPPFPMQIARGRLGVEAAAHPGDANILLLLRAALDRKRRGAINRRQLHPVNKVQRTRDIAAQHGNTAQGDGLQTIGREIPGHDGHIGIPAGDHGGAALHILAVHRLQVFDPDGRHHQARALDRLGDHHQPWFLLTQGNGRAINAGGKAFAAKKVQLGLLARDIHRVALVGQHQGLVGRATPDAVAAHAAVTHMALSRAPVHKGEHLGVHVLACGRPEVLAQQAAGCASTAHIALQRLRIGRHQAPAVFPLLGALACIAGPHHHPVPALQ